MADEQPQGAKIPKQFLDQREPTICDLEPDGNIHAVSRDALIVDLDGIGWLKRESKVLRDTNAIPDNGIGVKLSENGLEAHLGPKSGRWIRQFLPKDDRDRFSRVVKFVVHS